MAAVQLLQSIRAGVDFTFIEKRHPRILAVSALGDPMSWIDKILPSGVNKDESANRTSVPEGLWKMREMRRDPTSPIWKEMPR